MLFSVITKNLNWEILTNMLDKIMGFTSKSNV